jgi:hypothetical protein
MSLIAELARRKVLKVGGAYLVVVRLAVQAVSIGFPAFDAPMMKHPVQRRLHLV